MKKKPENIVNQDEEDDTGKPDEPSHFALARRRISLTRFYTDTGPREDWDGPLAKYVKISGLKRRRKEQVIRMHVCINYYTDFTCWAIFSYFALSSMSM